MVLTVGVTAVGSRPAAAKAVGRRGGSEGVGGRRWRHNARGIVCTSGLQLGASDVKEDISGWS